jgi:hypothetical protein
MPHAFLMMIIVRKPCFELKNHCVYLASCLFVLPYVLLHITPIFILIII